MAICFQIFCAAIICSQCFNMGLLGTWPTIYMKLFQSNSTPLHRPMTDTEVSLIGSSGAVGALISTPFTGYLLDKVGRKLCALACGLLHFIPWVLIVFFNDVGAILLALVISGAGATGALTVPVYVSEICENSIRGVLTACAVVSFSIGGLAIFTMEGFLSYDAIKYVCLCVAVISVLLTFLLKESPLYLMKKGLHEEAAKSLAFYKRAKVNSDVVMEAMDLLRKAFSQELACKRMIPEQVPLSTKTLTQSTDKPERKLTRWQIIKKSRSTHRAMLVTFVLLTASVLQGGIAVQIYSMPLFLDAVPNLSSTLCCIILAVVNVASGLTAAYLTDVAGRRPLMIYSSAFTGLCSLLLGSQLQSHWAPQWMTVVVIYVYTLGFTFGAATVPYVLVAEAFLPEVKTFMSSLFFEWLWVCTFIILFIFNPLADMLGLGVVFYIFAGICFFCAIFAYSHLPETKGKPIHVIQEMFLGRKTKSYIS